MITKQGMAMCALVLMASIGTINISALDFVPAMRDDFRAARYNPAGLGWEASHGIAGELSFENSTQDMPISGDVYFNADGLSYNFEVTDERTNHFLSAGFRPQEADWLGIGSALRLSTADAMPTPSVEFLIRPSSFLSFNTGVTWEELSRATLNASVAFRPIDEILTIGTASSFQLNTETLVLPLFELQLEPLEGVILTGSYNLDNSQARVLLSFDASNATVGGSSTIPLASTDAITGSTWLHIAPKERRSALTAGTKRAVRITGGSLAEAHVFEPNSPFAFLNSGTVLQAHLEHIAAVCNEPSVDALLFEHVNYIGSMAQFLEIEQQLLNCKQLGIEIYFYADYYGPLTYMLAASVADGIYVSAHGGVGGTVIEDVDLFLGEFLNNNGIQVYNFGISPYKASFDFLSESGASPENKENKRQIVEARQAIYEQRIVEGRGDALAIDVKQFAQQGPIVPTKSNKEWGLVDDELFSYEVEKYIREEHGIRVIQSDQSFVDTAWNKKHAATVAYIAITGVIGDQGGALPFVDTLNVSRVIDTLQVALDDPTVRAIVLRIDSPGGLGSAMHELANFISDARDRKPIVAWMGTLATSAAYGIPSAANYIIASPATLTGSIGVTSFHISLEDLLDEQGLNWDGVQAYQDADKSYPLSNLTDSELQATRTFIANAYRDLVQLVATNRGLDFEAVDAVAQGRVWNAQSALQHNLIDQVGYYDDLKVYLKELLAVDNIRFKPFHVPVNELSRAIAGAFQGGGALNIASLLGLGLLDTLNLDSIANANLATQHTTSAQIPIRYGTPDNALATPNQLATLMYNRENMLVTTHVNNSSLSATINPLLLEHYLNRYLYFSTLQQPLHYNSTIVNRSD